MCPGPESTAAGAAASTSSQKQQALLGRAAAAAAAADPVMEPVAGREGNGKEEGVWDFFRSYTDEPHRSRCVGVRWWWWGCVCVDRVME